MIEQFVETLSGYPGLLAFCLFSGIFLPWPEDFPLLYAGVRIQEGTFGWGPTLAIALFGVGVRDALAYWLGRVLGDRLLQSDLVQRWVGGERIERAEAMVRDRGVTAVLIGRFLIGFRAPVFAVAGASRVPFRQFLLWNGVGLLVAVPAAIWLGWFFGDSIAETIRFVMFRAREVVALVAVLSIGWAWYRVRNPEPAE